MGYAEASEEGFQVSIHVIAMDRLVANVEQPRLVVVPALGSFELAIYVNGFTVPRREQQPIIWFRPHQARVGVGTGFQHLGTGLPISHEIVRTLDTPAPFVWEFRLGLTTVQLAAI